MTKTIFVCFSLNFLYLFGVGDGNAYQCILSSALNTDHQFRCCYTDRDPKCQHVCIDNNKVCDGTPDCPDGRDEWTSLCSSTCKLGYLEFKGFQCKKAWRRCLAFNKFCDEEFDCAESELNDKSDEDQCDCFYNKDCPFYGNISAKLPPAPTIASTEPPGPQTNKTLITIVIVIIACLVLAVVAILVFFIKTHLSKDNRAASPAHIPVSPSAPTPNSQLISSPSRRLQSTTAFSPVMHPDAPPPYEEVDNSSSASQTSSLQRGTVN